MEPSPGDLIEIFRIYRHWAVYVGDGFVVHMVNPNFNSLTGSYYPCCPSLCSSPPSSQIKKDKGNVKRERLRDVVGKDSWRVNNKLDKTHRPRLAKEIVKEALSLVGEDMKFSLTDFNCEHFANKLRYGVSSSWQARVLKYTLAAGAGLLGGAIGTLIGPAGTALGATGAALYTKKFLDKLD